MSDTIRFTENSFPMTNRIWVDMSMNTTKEKVLEFIENHIEEMPEAINLEIHLYVSDPSETTDRNMEEILKEVYQYKTGYEKSFPIVSIYYPETSLKNEMIDTINELDIYRPGTRLYIIVTDEELPQIKTLADERAMAENLFKKIVYSQQLGLDTTLLFNVEKNPDTIETCLDIRRYVYTWDTSIDIKRPLIQVNPCLTLNKNHTKLLLNYIEQENGLTGIFNVLCGYTTLLARYIQNQKVPATIVPLLSCGTGISEKTLCKDGKIVDCFYAKNTLDKKDILEKCKTCEQVEGCTGCMCVIDMGKNCRLSELFQQL
ncbi:hypothetical protein [Anaeromicropila populeti]|uniref:Uncharacterized protein n=1 Tax=Anaeromicropila populeti TaxID=37658 RepID=A0A1I6L0Q5_9FIRM|nr:hypothetical protein [Anaeromicropila populeti]SFR97059.1 hypothetical protein SAMN05661086_02964 [Anaeromicropila populeti]